MKEPIKIKIIPLGRCASTNDEAYALAENGAVNGTTVTAREQTGGKGTNGRSFFSPGKTGVYMSVILRNVKKERLLDVTPMAAVAVSRVLDKNFGVETRIKWVNDVYLDGKKVCGILTKAQSKDGETDFIVVGIGINLFAPEGGFPEEIRNTAGFVSEVYDEALRQKTIEEIAQLLCEYAERLDDEKMSADIKNYYTERRIVIDEKG
ncbi:MAG: biotin--[acetyl-CoA-carboxylase] ligase [Oscillospiraceae bacterium]|nr:biotin--[acetyl-CoA-carboxylase] ligase [Oscillospiraceae bacterium]